MSYVKESLGEGEEIIYESPRGDILSGYSFLAWVAFFAGIFVWALAGIFWGVILGVVVGVLLMPLAVMDHYYILSIEKAITNKRIIFKEGLFDRETHEQLLSRVEKVEISQTSFQRTHERGDIKITGLGGNVMIFKNVANSLDVKKKIESLL